MVDRMTSHMGYAHYNPIMIYVTYLIHFIHFIHSLSSIIYSFVMALVVTPKQEQQQCEATIGIA